MDRKDREMRGWRLLSLGSHLSEEGPRAGFAERLKARLLVEERRSPARWSDAVGLVARPALGLAAAALLLSIGLYSAVQSTSPGDDLALLVGDDPMVNLFLSDNPIELLAVPEPEPR